MNQTAYYISVKGTRIKVTEEIYLAYYRSRRRERYYERDIKTEKPVRDKNGNITHYALSKEDSLERLLSTGKDFAGGQESIEDIVINRIMSDKLNEALGMLKKNERELIEALFFSNEGKGMTEREYAAICGIPHQTIHSRKISILARLKKILK